MSEEKPWEKFGIADDRLYTTDAQEYWNQIPIEELWEHILNVGGSYLSNIRRFAEIVDIRIVHEKTEIDEQEANRKYLSAITERTQQLEEMLVLMTYRLRAESKNMNAKDNNQD